MDSEVTIFRLRLPAPLDLGASLAPLGRWGDDGIDRWDGRRLLRVDRAGSAMSQPYRGLAEGTPEQPSLELTTRGPLSARDLAPRVAATFALVPDALAALARADVVIGRLVSTYPGVVPVLVPDPLTALVRSISAQQVNLRWAAEVRRRIANRYGTRHELSGEGVHALDAEALARASEEDLRSVQLTRAKSRAVIACARATVDGRLERAELERLDDEQLIERLTTLPGIGRWSAEWFLARTLGRPRVVAGDLGVRKAVGRLYRAGQQGLPSETEVRHLTAHWGAAATVAQVLALHDLATFSEATVASVPAPAPPAGRSC